MNNDSLKTLTLLLVLLVLVINPVIAGVIVKYETGGYTTSTPPPIHLQQPSDTQVYTSIGAHNTSANVSVYIPSTYTISLESRRAVYWNNFDDYDPLATGELVPLNNDTCTWSWDSVNGELVGETTGLSVEYGGECILLINRTIPVDQEIYLDINMMWDGASTYPHYSDLVYMNKTSGLFYTIGNNYRTDRVYLWLWDGAWNLLDSARFSGWSFYTDTWYDLLGMRNNTNGYLAEIYEDTLQVDTYDTTVQVDTVGLGLYSFYGEIVRYDLILLTLGGPPYYVNVTGLEPGWYVEIYDENYNLLASVQSTGTQVSIDFWDYKMVKNGTIVVRDSGYNYITSNTFSWIIGGDTYHVGYASYGSTYNILGFVNNDTDTTFNVSLILSNITISSGSPGILYELDIWIDSGGQVTDPITVYYNSTGGTYEVGSWSTSVLKLYPLYPGNIYLYWYSDPGVTVSMTLLFVYWISGVLVVYPINVTVYS